MTASLHRLDLNSDHLPAGTALSAWASAMPEFEVSQPEGVEVCSFRIRVTAWLLGDVVITHGHVTAVRFERSTSRAKADGTDTCNLILFTKGTTIGDVEGRSITLGPGQILSMDYTRPAVWQATDNDFVTVSIARAAMLGVQPHLPDFHGQLLESPSGRLLVDYLIALVRQLPDLKSEDAADIAAATLTLVKSAFSALPARSDADVSEALRQRVRRLINQQLQDPNLTPTRLAEELGISRSLLYASCEPLGGISNYIKGRRLEAVRALLTVQNEGRSISELAEAYGFKTLPHFSDAFRDAFGQTPGAVRKMGVRMRAPIAPHVSGDTVDSFRSWMRQLAAR